MKKTYVKPELVVESFQLDAAVAASCSQEGYKVINKAQDECMDADTGFFGMGCTHIIYGSDGKYGTEDDTICYHGPDGLGLVFLQS